MSIVNNETTSNINYDKEWIAHFKKQGCLVIKKLSIDKKWCGVVSVADKYILLVDMTDESCRYNFCFSSLDSAVAALNSMTTIKDIPTGWFSCKPSDRLPQPYFEGEDIYWGINFFPTDYFLST